LKRHRILEHTFFNLARAADEPGAIVTRADVELASDAAETEAWRMAETAPISIAGAAAMLSYIADEDCIGLFDTGERAWHETAFRTVAAALAQIASA
jgi:hypothetical protein